MKARLLGCVMLTCYLPAHADWVSYQRHTDHEEFYDNQFLSRQGDVIKLWTLTEHKQPITSLEGQELLSEKFLTAVDCAVRKTGSEKVMKYTGRRAEGTLVSTMDTTLRMASVRKGSADEELLNRVCQ
ncbi:MAG: surface-adhesin E family protein [Oxalobacteraceae bacterium]